VSKEETRKSQSFSIIMSEDPNNEFDFLADGSMRELAMKMDLIDQQLADLTTDTSSSNIQADKGNNNHSDVGNMLEYSTADLDDYVDADEGAEALSSLQQELQQAQEAADHDKKEEAATSKPSEPQPREMAPPPPPNAAAAAAVVTPDRSGAGTPAGGVAPTATVVMVDGRKYHHYVISAIKPEPSAKVGISMKTSKGNTLIVAVTADGLLAGKGLMEGHKLIKVNGIDVKNARHARVLIQSAATKVSVEVLEDLE
jgi:PDZ domain